MHTKVNISDFDVFQNIHNNDFVVIVSGSWHYETGQGSYIYQTRYKGVQTRLRQKELPHMRSSNAVMLEAVLDACTRIQYQDKDVFVLSPTTLGFKKGEKGSGPNADIVQSIFKVCSEKNLTLNTIAICGGASLIKHAFLSSQGL